MQREKRWWEESRKQRPEAFSPWQHSYVLLLIERVKRLIIIKEALITLLVSAPIPKSLARCGCPNRPHPSVIRRGELVSGFSNYGSSPHYPRALKQQLGKMF